MLPSEFIESATSLVHIFCIKYYLTPVSSHTAVSSHTPAYHPTLQFINIHPVPQPVCRPVRLDIKTLKHYAANQSPACHCFYIQSTRPARIPALLVTPPVMGLPLIAPAGINEPILQCLDYEDRFACIISCVSTGLTVLLFVTLLAFIKDASTTVLVISIKLGRPILFGPHMLTG